MMRMKRGRLWLWLLTKRLYHRPALLVLLVVIPALVLGYTAINTAESGMMTVAVAQEETAAPQDAVLETLNLESQLIYFRPCPSPEEAETLVSAGKADAAWIFPADLEAGIAAFVESPGDHPFIRVLVREDNVMLRLSRERLSGATFPAIARQVFLSFVRQLAPELDTLSDRELLARYDRTEIVDNLFSFSEDYTQLIQTHYLLAPLRGLLGLVILLCALATAMYHLRDLRDGTFCRLPTGRRWGAELAGQLTAVGHVAAAAALCLGLAGLSAGLWQELALWALYSLACAAFAMALRRIFGSLRLLAALLPALAVLMLVLCPVFFDLNPVLALRHLFPLTYYIYAANQPLYLLHLAAYTGLCFGVYALAGHLPGRKER